MINDLRSLTQLGLTHKIVPQCQFQGWLSKVLIVESVTLANNEDFDFVSDVLDHQFVANDPAQAPTTRRNCGPSGGGNGHPPESYHTLTRGSDHQHPPRKDKREGEADSIGRDNSEAKPQNFL